MVEKKKILSDLKKYNQDLDKHLDGLSFDFFEKNKILENNSELDDYFSIIGNSLIDFKKEILNLKSDLRTDLIQVFEKQIDENKKEFSKQINGFYDKILFDFKKNILDEIFDMKNQVTFLNENLKKTCDENKKLSSKFDDLKIDILKLKDNFLSFNQIKDSDKKLFLMYFKEMNSKIEGFNFDLNKSLKNIFNTNKLTFENDFKQLEDENNLENLAYLKNEKNFKKRLDINDKLKKLDSLR